MDKEGASCGRALIVWGYYNCCSFVEITVSRWLVGSSSRSSSARACAARRWRQDAAVGVRTRVQHESTVKPPARTQRRGLGGGVHTIIAHTRAHIRPRRPSTTEIKSLTQRVRNKARRQVGVPSGLHRWNARGRRAAPTYLHGAGEAEAHVPAATKGGHQRPCRVLKAHLRPPRGVLGGEGGSEAMKKYSQMM